jgi:hypothetical protein
LLTGWIKNKTSTLEINSKPVFSANPKKQSKWGIKGKNLLESRSWWEKTAILVGLLPHFWLIL